MPYRGSIENKHGEPRDTHEFVFRIGDTNFPYMAARAQMNRPCDAAHDPVTHRAYMIGVDLLPHAHALRGIHTQIRTYTAQRFRERCRSTAVQNTIRLPSPIIDRHGPGQ